MFDGKFENFCGDFLYENNIKEGTARGDEVI